MEKAGHSENAGGKWTSLYRVGGVAALVAAIFFRRNLAAEYMLFPSLDAVLIFGVLPAPMLPLDRLLPEMQRILKPGGLLSIWPPSWVPASVPRSGLFTFSGKHGGVYNFRRI